MKEYSATIMSIDPQEDPDDNHQKYSVNFEAEPGDDLQLAAVAAFEGEHGDLPIYWVKIN